MSWLLSAIPLTTTQDKCQHLWTCLDFRIAIVHSTISHSRECWSIFSLLVLGFCGWSHFGMFNSRGWSFFLLCHSFVPLHFFVWSVKPQGVCWNIWIFDGSHHDATVQIHANKFSNLHTSRHVPTSPFCDVIHLIFVVLSVLGSYVFQQLVPIYMILTVNLG